MRLIYLLSIFLIQGLVFTLFLLFKFTTSKASPFLHLISLSIILIILISLFNFIFKNNNKVKRKKYIFIITFGTLNFALLIFYALTIYGYFHWSAAFTFELFNAYIDQIPKILSIMGISIFYVIFLFLLFLFAIWSVYFYLSKYILITSHDIKNINFKIFKFNISLKPITSVQIIMLFSTVIYASTYQAWLPREPFAIAVTNNWQLSSLAPSELFSSVAPSELLSSLASNEIFLTELEIEKSVAGLNINDSNIKPRPLVLITVDALRSDQMGVYGGHLNNTPFLSSLLEAKQLQKFGASHSICTLSFCGLLGILRSNYWSGLKKPTPTLSDVLNIHHYESIFLLSGDHTNFGNLKNFYGKNIDFYKDGSWNSGEYLNDDFEVLNWVTDIHPKTPQSTFIYIHLMSVHEAGIRRKEFVKWQPSTVPLLGDLIQNNNYEMTYRNNYNNGILQTDEIIRQIFKELKAKKILDTALVIISADHGEYLGEFNRFHHGQEPYEPVSRIPLLVYDPVNPHYPERLLSSQVDIAATFLYAIGAKMPSGWQGIPLQIETSRSAVSIASGETEGVVALIDHKKYKYLRKTGDMSELLFDLDSPEAETKNLVSLNEEQGTLLKMRAIYNASER